MSNSCLVFSLTINQNISLIPALTCGRKLLICRAHQCFQFHSGERNGWLLHLGVFDGHFNHLSAVAMITLAFQRAKPFIRRAGIKWTYTRNIIMGDGECDMIHNTHTHTKYEKQSCPLRGGATNYQSLSNGRNSCYSGK